MTTHFTPPYPLNTPVLFLVFNRPDTTRQVFEAIREAKPPRLYIAADGPRSNKASEAEKCAEVRKIATAVDWPCQVRTLFRDQNLGCKMAVSGAITWFFEQEEQGIILEDDCLPNQSFFWFCEELLNKYKDNERIWSISGNNFQNGIKRGNASYYFSNYSHIWGWATWRRAWQHYAVQIPYWPDWSQSSEWNLLFVDKIERNYWAERLNEAFENLIDTWDFQWLANIWYHKGLAINPQVNLVTNMGFGVDATHTTKKWNRAGNVPTQSIQEIQHPTTMKRNIEADKYDFEYRFGGRFMRFPLNIAVAIYRFFKVFLKGFFVKLI